MIFLCQYFVKGKCWPWYELLWCQILLPIHKRIDFEVINFWLLTGFRALKNYGFHETKVCQRQLGLEPNTDCNIEGWKHTTSPFDIIFLSYNSTVNKRNLWLVLLTLEHLDFQDYRYLVHSICFINSLRLTSQSSLFIPRWPSTSNSFFPPSN